MGLVLIVILALIAVAVFGVVGIYNSLVRLRQTVRNAWSQIDVQLKRRYDLIPNLVETVKGYATHEQETLEAVIQARNAGRRRPGRRGEQAQAENVLTGALRQLFALSESYPDLKANQNFLALQEELATTENRIAFARQHYNDADRHLQHARAVVPGQHPGRDVQLHHRAVLRDRGRGPARGPQGPVLGGTAHGHHLRHAHRRQPPEVRPGWWSASWSCSWSRSTPSRCS